MPFQIKPLVITLSNNIDIFIIQDEPLGKVLKENGMKLTVPQFQYEVSKLNEISLSNSIDHYLDKYYS